MLVVIEKLNKKFGSFQALYDVSAEIKKGEFIAILGPSGCGKTTLLRILAGFENPTGGRILIDGSEVSGPGRVVPPEKRNTGMVFQNFALWPHMTLREHIEFPLRNHRFTSAKDRKSPEKRIEEVLNIIGMENLGNRLPGQLSGGQKQRVALGRAIAHKPQLLLMDEPLSSLDAELRKEMRQEIEKLHKITGSTIIYVTHDQEEALAMADRIMIMKDGRIEQFSAPSKIYYRPETEFTARFVSHANFFKGTWMDDGFIPKGTDILWKPKDISEKIKEKNLYTLRPEEILITSPSQSGLEGIISSVQFQGKEYHYTAETLNHGTISVHTPFSEKHALNSKVSIIPR